MQPSRSKVTERNGLYELDAGPEVLDSPRYNHDIAPTQVHERTWNKWHITALWVGMSICVPTYTLGGVLTAYFGLSVGEALLAILLANIVVLIPLTLNAFAGTKYGIPFPVLLRSSFGIIGSNVPCLIRALVACGWFGIQTLFGGLAIHLFLGSVFEGWKSLGGTGEVIGFMVFWALNLWVVLRGAESIKWLETLSAPLLVLVGIGLLVWALPNVSMTELLAQPPKRPEGASVYGYFFAGLTAMVGFWATLSLNIPDFSRYAKSQKDQILGQIFGLPLTMFLFAALGVVLTAASEKLVGVTVSDPVSLIGHIQSPGWVALAMALIIIATLSTNTAANIVSPTNDFQNIAPKLINRTKAVMLTGLVGLALMAHELLKKLGLLVSDVSLETVYSNWLLGYSSLLGPIAGIMVVDYFIIRRQKLDLAGLYHDGVYPAWHWNGFIAFGIPVVLTLLSLGSSAFSWFYDFGWFTGSLLGAGIYYGLHRMSSQQAETVKGTV
ncbi:MULTISPECIES: NCS1 family nucleobase:cation symporter-1 [Pseudomonas]|jgi:NCS1 family nucleobase:cation symporter-1|uniref:NCS1 family nucleobase:cation symporter-1 n=1 Tax=Pseudomonas psychrophila TaxID=122355 RepID=A0A8I1FPX2_9PSED|nr:MULTISPECIES: NCS1 family nucleobase:cation symporter-1 [Pseudomonas]EPJ91263.1 NCS1 nucleoside transporter [Pseudomonas psychrophila]KAB0489468.1 NCS1 family nucleobase:cation symporter-1 [Pseudomonas psychrophila]KMM98776.1 nitrate reductase [Pseudomonas psychrophila]MBJ2258502.1 NCS1 family nucleobase:cation symporter-1 [Pseudomonas psychrophila]MDY7584808.1 NCS1 family nucleobase:cation symporter-1 [Pseudomonas sp. CCI3.1]